MLWSEIWQRNTRGKQEAEYGGCFVNDGAEEREAPYRGMNAVRWREWLVGGNTCWWESEGT